MPQVNLFGPVDAVLGAEIGIAEVLVIEAILLGLVVLNFVTRRLAHGKHVEQARDDGAEAVSRYLPHEVLNVVLVVLAFYYMTVEYHGGMVTSALVVGLVITDFFEFEARKVEARREIPIEQPKGSMFAAVLVLLYAGYQAVFFLLAPLWGAVI